MNFGHTDSFKRSQPVMLGDGRVGSQTAVAGGREGVHLSGRATLPCLGLELFFLRRRLDWLPSGRDARRQGLAQRVGFENLSFPFFFSFFLSFFLFLACGFLFCSVYFVFFFFLINFFVI